MTTTVDSPPTAPADQATTVDPAAITNVDDLAPLIRDANARWQATVRAGYDDWARHWAATAAVELELVALWQRALDLLAASQNLTSITWLAVVETHAHWVSSALISGRHARETS